MKITREEMVELIDNSNGLIFSVIFIKKDGTIRKMHCRTRVRKYLKGGILKFNVKKRGLKVVYDLTKKGYRMINLNTLQQVSIKREVYNVK